MITGRPRKPLAAKKLEGDTRQRGANKFAASLAEGWEARRGEPEMPVLFRSRRGEDPELRNRLRTAREYWKYLIPAMQRDGLLAEVDQGTLVGCVLAFAAMAEAGRAGETSKFERHSREYRGYCDRMGLNEVARARLDRQAPNKPAGTTESKMAEFLKSRKTA